MFKSHIKLLILSLVFISIGVLFAGGHAAADQACAWAPGANWGVNLGGGSGAMAGAIVHSTRDTGNGAELDSQYTLSAYSPDGGNNKIFRYPAGAAGRNDQQLFATGSTITTGDPNDPATLRSESCLGWDVLGPGQSVPDPAYPSPGHMTPKRDQWGNGWVLDCGTENGPSSKLTQFWISRIPKPPGEDGHWEVQVFSGDGGGQLFDIDDYFAANPGPSNPRTVFRVVNGLTVRINLIWHTKDKPKEPATGTCQFLDIGNPILGEGASYVNVGGSHPTAQHVRAKGMTVGKINGNVNQGTNIDGYAPGDTGGVGNKTWNYQPYSNSIQVTTTQAWYKDTDPNKGMHDIPGAPTYYLTPDGQWTATVTWIPCFGASCVITSIDGTGPEDSSGSPVVLAGGIAHIHGTYNSTSPPPSNLTIWNPAVQNTDQLGKSSSGIHTVFVGPAYDGYSYDFSFDVPAPTTLVGGYVNFTPIYLPGYPGDTLPGAIGSGCDGRFITYQDFTLTPHADLNYKTAENPGPIGYDTYITNSSSAAVSAPTTSTFTATPYSGSAPCSNAGPVNTNGPYNSGGPDYTIGPSTCNPSSINAGDKYCSEIDLTSYNRGDIGSDGSIVNPSLDPTIAKDKHCVTIVNEPYFKVYGTGISAGGSFQQANGTCTANPGAGLLAGWNDNSGAQDRGAGSQLSALALIKITGFASAQANASNSPTNLTFANANLPAGAIGSDRESPALGGQFNPGSCYPLPDASISTDPTSDATTLNSTANDLDPSGITVGAGDNKSIFVNGDVYISHDILYGSGWDISNAPSFVLHATGNIYIDPSVTELDGLYIAHTRSDGTGGKIYTCATAVNTPCPISGLYTQPNNNKQLLIRGAFVASQVNFMRTYGSLRDSQSGEQLTGASHPCSHAGSGNKPVCAAEIFEFSPELYLSAPAIQLQNMGGPQWDAITSLPPVL